MIDPMGIFLLIAGIIFAIWPYSIAKFGEELKAMGTEQSAYSVEPTDLNVWITRIVGVASAIIGLVGLFIE